MNILVVPDAHVRPGVGFTRFKALGNYINETRPDVVVQLGDWADMPSLSSYDVGKKEFEGRSYKADIDAVNESIELLEETIRKPKKKLPRRLVLQGNHENRIVRVVNSDRKLDGTVSYDDFLFRKRGWEILPFLDVIEIEGIAFSHYLVSGVLAKPIGGENHAASLIKKQLTSCVVGHGHNFDYAERTSASGKRIQAIVAGCFIEPGQVEAYAGPAQKMWRNCIVKLNNVKEGQFDFEVISTETLTQVFA